MKIVPISAALLCVALLPSWMTVEGGGQAPPPNNILLIVLDDVGVETLGCFNSLGPTVPTPRLTQLANTGVKFTHVYANPVCSPTRATIMTGRYAFRTGMGFLASTSDTDTVEWSIPLSEVTIPEALSNVAPSYTCGAFGKWHLTVSGDLTHPIDQGFDLFVGSVGNTGDHFSWDKIIADSTCAISEHIGQPYSTCTGTFNESTFSASVIRQEATAWIQTASEPFFAYVCFNPPHHPWQVPPYTLLSAATLASFNHAQYPEGETQTGAVDSRKAYGWMLEAVDTEVGRLVDNIPAGKLAHTTILIVSDNGTPGPVIDTTNPAIMGPPQQFYQAEHAKGTVFEQGVNVPMIANGYKVSTAGQACTRLVNTVDIWRTCIALAGALPPQGVTYDGKSFKGLLANPGAASIRPWAFSQLYIPNGTYDPLQYPDICATPVLRNTIPDHQRSITDGQYKYIRRYVAPFQQAFDLVADPLEKTDLWVTWGWPQTADPCSIPTQSLTGQSQVWTLRDEMVGLSAP